MTLAAVGSGSDLGNLDAFRQQCRENAEQFETVGSAPRPLKVTREAPSRISFLLKDPRGHADFYAALARHNSRGSANTMRSFQGGRPSIYTLTDAIRKVPTPALIICGDEDDNCIEPQSVPEEAFARVGADVLPEVRPRAQSGRARSVQRNGQISSLWLRPDAGRCATRDRSVSTARLAFRHGVNIWLAYRAFPARLSRNTPCSPNMFQNHQGAFSRSGRP